MHENPSKNETILSSRKKPGYLENQLLIAMPSLKDPYFQHSVTLICQHDEQGCFGLTINKPIDVTIDEVLEKLNIAPEISTKESAQALRGGPVQIEQGFVIHDSDKEWENTLFVCDDISVTASKDILLDIAAGKGPKNYILTLGCASWSAGQMEAEVLENSWLNCPIDKKIIFNMPYEERWQGAADILGVDMNAMSGFSGHD